jgi:ATP-dependent helicase/nuclease subunit A
VGIENILEGLNEKQLDAVRAETNAVVSAGAGSGKTSVIAARYAWLVMKKKIPLEEILTLTFTNKAVNEMYSRIYSTLAAQTDNPEAREAVAYFNRANIVTLDSFCTGVARIAARRYGISPDFTCDPEGVQALALDSALPFALNRLESRGLRTLLGDKKIQNLAEDLFAGTVLNTGSIAAPRDFRALWEKQRDETGRVWGKASKEAVTAAERMRSSLGEIKNPGEQFAELLRKGAVPPVPDIPALLDADDSGEAVRKQVRAFFAYLEQFCSVSFKGSLSPEKKIVKEHRDALKEIEERLESLALFALSAGTIREVFSLLEEYQRDFHQKQRELGILSFRDIAELAVDALTRFPDLRRFYKRSFSAIMIDEFQDNNELQRDLIFLLAEDEQYQEAAVPGLPKLNPNKMIFVGDEKQSIYRFRGADVSVFRKLSDSFSRPAGPEDGPAVISLDKNYRSRPVLINAFNYFFGGIAPGGKKGGASIFLEDRENFPGFEARYEAILPGLGEPDPGDIKNPPLHFCFLDADSISGDDASRLSGGDLEAAYIAMKIREMVDQGYQIQTRSRSGTGKRSCGYGDMAVLLRTLGHQILLEKQFQNFGIPYSADDPAGLFSDAPINDLFNFLRILVYPHDKAAYAALIRSPLCGLSDMVLSVCMLDSSGIPFNGELEKDIPEEERAAFRKSRELYRSLAQEARIRPAADLLTRLWYEEGYRYEILWSPPAQIYGELFDFFFELARRSERRGQTLAEFLDDFAELIKNEERVRELRIPAEREGGVRIMTIHKSKGLEFPVVFIPECQSTIRPGCRGETVFFSKDWGLSFKLPGAEELPSGDIKNYFYLLQKDDEEQKAVAELRRLLYVAMTRAESRLFLSAVLPPRTADEREAWEGAAKKPEDPWIPERLIELQERRKDSKSLPGFLDLLLPVLAAGDHSLYTLETIPAYSRAELSRLYAAGRREKGPPAMDKAAAAAADFYEKTPAVSPPRPPAPGFNASALHYTPLAETVSPKAAPDDIEAILQAANLEPAEFGTIVHAYLEAPAYRGKNRIPPRFLSRLSEKAVAAVDAAARDMAEKFLASDLGRRSRTDPNRESEYPILTMVETGGTRIPINGVIDLLFESEGAVWVVDFKTDKTEEPERHLAQLAVYSRAASDIFGKPVRAWIFFLRSGSARELTAALEQVDLEQLIFSLNAQAPEARRL